MQSDETSGTVIKAWARLVRAANTTLGAVEQDLKAAGLPPLGWYDVLLELKRAGDEGLRPYELEHELLLAQHNVSRLLERLAKQRLVERRPCREDGRGLVVAITPAGLDLLTRMWPVYRSSIGRHVGAKLTEGEADSVQRLLAKLVTTSS
jgi:DNA-binding MarR family transcriptional regulator